MSLRFGMLLPGPFFVSAGSSSTKQTSSDLEAKLPTMTVASRLR